MQLHTQRLLLRDYIPSDFADMLAYESDPQVVEYVCYGPYSEKECRQQLTYHIAHQSASPRKYYHLGMVMPQTEWLVGWCGLEVIDTKNRDAEIGYALHRDYWGHGYMTEAARAVLQFGFEELNFHRIFATCHPKNGRSIRVLEKLEMRYEGCLREQKWCRGVWRDTAVYALLEHEWRSQDGTN